eukprot:CAMPEP_0182425010 /NCGR_PEP_ID=MMETSP1167-20130531/11334_1 /TAXON_ID=2988 /ORGANISM="Mallomonas Sp, Strain CCMP3275" /LENGTH=217 /DNA_ID=CAMNT_0024605295 /DNA_START=195 /DNA_END=848 /DNA_ORIENTATION=+
MTEKSMSKSSTASNSNMKLEHRAKTKMDSKMNLTHDLNLKDSLLTEREGLMDKKVFNYAISSGSMLSSVNLKTNASTAVSELSLKENIRQKPSFRANQIFSNMVASIAADKIISYDDASTTRLQRSATSESGSHTRATQLIQHLLDKKYFDTMESGMSKQTQDFYSRHRRDSTDTQTHTFDKFDSLKSECETLMSSLVKRQARRTPRESVEREEKCE